MKLDAARLSLTALLAAALLASACGHGRLGAAGVPEVEGDGSRQVARVANTLAVNASDPDAWATLAAVHLHRGDVAAARAAARRALAGDPEHVGATVVAARIEVSAGRPEDGLPLYARAFAIRPALERSLARERADAMMDAAERFAARGESDHAADTLRRLDEAYPVHADRLKRRRAEAWIAACDAFIAQEVPERAREALERARALDADAGEVAFAVAALKVLAGAPDPPDDLAVWARRTDSGARWMRVGRFLRAHRPREAGAAFLEAAAALPEDPAPLSEAARTALTYETAAVARDHWLAAAGRAAASRPAEAAELLWVGAAELLATRHPAEAGALLAAAARLLPDDPGTLEAAASALVTGRRHAALVKLATAWRDAHRGDEDALLAAAAVLVRGGAPAVALKLLDEASPGEPSVAVALARVEAWIAGRRAEPPIDDAQARAVAQADAVERRVWDDPASLYRLGLARFALGDRRGAERLGRRLAEVPGGAGYRVLLSLTLSPALARRPSAAAGKLASAVSPEDADPAFALTAARWLAARRDTAGAIRWYRAALGPSAARSAREEAHGALASLLVAATPPEPTRAVHHLDAWLAEMPPARRPGALTLRGREWGANGAARPAFLALLEELARLRPDDEGAAIARFQVLGQLRRNGALREAGEAWVRIAARPSVAARRVGEELRRRGRDLDAAALLARSAPEQVTEPALHATLSAFFERAGDGARARRHAALFIDSASDSRTIGPVKLLTFADQLLERGHPELAIRAARVVLASNRDSIKGTQVLARGLLRTGRDDEARALLADYVDGSTRRTKKRLEDVARIYAAEGDLRLAAGTLELRVQADRTPNLAIFNELANTYRELGDVASIERVAREVVGRASGAAQGRLYEAAAGWLSAVGDLDAARDILVRGLAAHSRGRRLMASAFENAIRRGDRGEAVGAARAIGRAGGPLDWVRVIDGLTRGGMADGALEALDAAVAIIGQEPALYAARGRAHFALGDAEAAHADFVAALTQTTSVREILDEATPVYLRAGQGERLRDLQSRALAMGAGRSDHLVALAASLVTAGRDDEGRQLVARYLAGNPRGELLVANALADVHHEGEALEHFGRAFEHVTGKEAQAALRRAAELLASRGEGARLDELVRLYLVASEGSEAPELVAVGDAYARVGRPAEAIQWYERADRAAPTTELAWTLGTLKDALGDDAGARTAFSRFVARAAASRAARRRPDQGAAAVERVVERYIASGRARDGVTFVQGLEAGETRGGWAAVLRARARLAAGDDADLLAGVGEPFSSWSSDPAALKQVRALIDALLDHGRLGEARTLVQRAIAAGWDTALGAAAARVAAEEGRVTDAVLAADALAQWHGTKALGLTGTVLAEIGLDAAAGARLREAVETPGAGAASELAGALARVDADWPPTGDAAQPGAPLVPSRRDVIERGLMTARVAFQRGAYGDALAALDFPLSASPRDVGPWRMALRAAAQIGDEAVLDDLLERMERRKLDRSAALDEAIVILVRASAFELGLRAVDRSVALQRSAYRPRLLGIELALACGRREDAARRAERLVADVLDGAAVRVAVAEVYARWMYLDEARALLAEIPGGVGRPAAERERVLASVAARAGDAEATRAACAAFVEASYGERWARVSCARTVADAGGSWPVVAEVLALALAEEASSEALTLGAVAAWRSGDEAAGRSAWKRLRARFPFEPRGLRELLEGAVAGGDAVSAEEIAAHARRVAALDVVEVATVAAASVDAGSDAETRELVRALLSAAAEAVGPGNVAVATGWERLLVASGDPGAGARVLEAAWSRQPRSALAANNLAWALTGPGGDAARALAVAERALALPPSPLRVAEDRVAGVELPLPSLLDTKAWALHRLGRSAEALALVDRALHLVTSEHRATGGEIASHRGALLEALGRPADAALAWRDCAARGPSTSWGRRCRAKLLGSSAPR